jgi:hypothetical protein
MPDVTVPVEDLLRWADDIDDEIGLDQVAAELRIHASCPTGDLDDIVRRVRAAGVASGCGCQGRFRCSYHEGWQDALDALEDEL